MPLQEHLCRAASVFSYLKLIIQIIQSYATNFDKFYMDIFRFPSSNFFFEKVSVKLCFYLFRD